MTAGGEQAKIIGGQSLYGDLTPLTSAAHELKAPLALIRQLSIELESSITSAENQEIVEQIRLVAEKSLRLSTNLTKVSRSQAELFPSSPINAGQVFDEVERELSPLYRAHGRRLTQRRKSKMPIVIANRDLLRRILCNFADNALHYADEDGAVELFMQLKRGSDVVRLGVRDFGPMLPSSVWKSLQAGTAQLEKVQSRPDSSGLGLHISGQFAEAIGAKLGATRHRDGASFYIDVPISKQLLLL